MTRIQPCVPPLELGQARYIIPDLADDFHEVSLIILFHVRLLGGLYFRILLYGIPICFCAGPWVGPGVDGDQVDGWVAEEVLECRGGCGAVERWFVSLWDWLFVVLRVCAA